MKTIYEVRSSDGLLKFTLPKKIAFEVFASVDGDRKVVTFKGGKKVSRFTLKEDIGFKVPHGFGQEIGLCLWKGDRIDTIEKD